MWTNKWSFHCSRLCSGRKPGSPLTTNLIHSCIRSVHTYYAPSRLPGTGVGVQVLGWEPTDPDEEGEPRHGYQVWPDTFINPNPLYPVSERKTTAYRDSPKPGCIDKPRIPSRCSRRKRRGSLEPAHFLLYTVTCHLLPHVHVV